MSEPIRLWDKFGIEVVTHSPSWAHAQVIAGLLFVEPPAVPVVLTPDDTQDVPVVPTGKARRKGKDGGGVL